MFPHRPDAAGLISRHYDQWELQMLGTTDQIRSLSPFLPWEGRARRRVLKPSVSVGNIHPGLLVKSLEFSLGKQTEAAELSASLKR